MTPARKQTFISSLGLCTAYWLFPVEGSTVLAAPPHQPQDEAVRDQIAEEALLQYYNPLAALEDIKPLKQSKKPLTHTIKSGDTLSEIAKQYNLTTEQLARFNQISNIDVIRAGQTLNIPYRSKEIRVDDAQDVQSIAKEYKVSTKLIEHLNPDISHTDGELYMGQVVAIPERIEQKKASTQQKQPQQKPDEKKSDGIRLATRSEAATTQAAAETFSGSFAWPTGGQITSQYGMRNGRMHQGIDIWNAQKGETPIKAAAAGVVSRAGHDGNYGNLVVIDHGDGWSTYYAHLRVIQVSKGQQVDAGSRLGYMGQSGNATGFHLHFEVRKNEESIDPLNVLP